MKYYEIHCTDGGSTYLTVYESKEELLAEFAEELEDTDGTEGWNFYIPKLGMTNLQGIVGRILIKGETVIPKPKQIVTEYDVE